MRGERDSLRQRPRPPDATTTTTTGASELWRDENPLSSQLRDGSTRLLSSDLEQTFVRPMFASRQEVAVPFTAASVANKGAAFVEDSHRIIVSPAVLEQDQDGASS
jgi:hypothetical protein